MLNRNNKQVSFIIRSGMDHSGSQFHVLLPRARVGFSPYLQHTMGLGLAHWVTRNFRGVPTLEHLQLIFFKNAGFAHSGSLGLNYNSNKHAQNFIRDLCLMRDEPVADNLLYNYTK